MTGTPNFLELNRRAIKDKGYKITSEWLEYDQNCAEVIVDRADDGSPIFVVGGQSQDSRKNTRLNAEKFLEKTIKPPVSGDLYLCGLGSPVLLELLLEKYEKVRVFEANSQVTKAFLSLKDFTKEINDENLIIISPWDLYEGLFKGKAPSLSPLVITHPPSKRRETPLFQRFYLSLKHIIRQKPKDLRILIIPALSGGSLSMGPFLKKAGDSLDIDTKLLSFSEDLYIKSNAFKKSVGKEASIIGTNIFREALQDINNEVLSYKPHLILALAQAPIDLNSLIQIKDSFPECLIAYWFVEDYQKFSYAKDIAPGTDFFFHIQGPLMEPTLKDWGLKNAYYLPTAADDDFFKPQTVKEEYRSIVSFMGAAYPNRLNIFEKLIQNYKKNPKNKEKDFIIFGSGWEKASNDLKKYLFQDGRRVTPEETALIYAGSTINLNIHSGNGQGFFPKSYFVNPRTFEIASSAAFQIVDQRPLLNKLFNNDELCVIKNPDELPEQIAYYLKNKELREEIGKKARLRVQKEHLYKHRLEFILKLAFKET